MRFGAFLLSMLLIPSVARGQAKPLKVFDLPCHDIKNLPFSGEKSEFKQLESIAIEGINIQRKAYEFAEEQIVFLGACDSKEKIANVNDKYYGRQASVVRGFISYETGERVFAYRFAAYVVMTKNGFITTRAGAMGDVYYIDISGNGEFERYRGKDPLKNLPSWLRDR